MLLLVKFKSYDDDKKYREIPFVISLLIGGTLGFISGVVGIGGGIFLSPILFLIRAAKPKDIITTASIFILINSIAGVFGQLTKNETLNYVLEYWPLLIAVLVGGQIKFYKYKIFTNSHFSIDTICCSIVRCNQDVL